MSDVISMMRNYEACMRNANEEERLRPNRGYLSSERSVRLDSESISYILGLIKERKAECGNVRNEITRKDGKWIYNGEVVRDEFISELLYNTIKEEEYCNSIIKAFSGLD